MTLTPDLPSLTALQAFEAALRHRSFTRAAAELFRTQGAISRQVAALEKELGVTLFHRGQKELRPTPAAIAFGSRVRTALQALGEAVEDTRAARAEGAVLHVATLPSFGTRWLAARLGGFYARHPETSIHLGTHIHPFDFDAEDFDLAIAHGRGSWPGAHLERLMADEVVVVLAPELAIEHQVAEPADLGALPLLRLESRTSGWREWFEAAGIDPASGRDGGRFEHQLMVLEAALAGLGAALLPTFLVRDELRRGSLVSPFPDRVIDTGAAYWLAWPPRSDTHPGRVAFVTWLQEALTEDGLISGRSKTQSREGAETAQRLRLHT